MDFPVYFLSWTTYGTWLPGDPRGWVDGRDAGAAVPINEPDSHRYEEARRRMRGVPVILSPEDRSAIDQLIRNVAEFKQWRILALNVRTNHIHVVLLAPDKHPDRVMSQLKANATQVMKKRYVEQGRPLPHRWWTRHGSTRYLNDEVSVVGAVKYVRDGQD